jgi:hypothetical protein
VAQGGGNVDPEEVSTGSDGLAAVSRVLGPSAGDQTTIATVSGLQAATFTSRAVPEEELDVGRRPPDLRARLPVEIRRAAPPLREGRKLSVPPYQGTTFLNSGLVASSDRLSVLQAALRDFIVPCDRRRHGAPRSTT